MRIPSLWFVPVWLVAAGLGGVTASAQVTTLDKGRLIDSLQREGMSELLLHLVEVEPPKDPVEAQLIKLAQLQLRYRDDGDRLDEEQQIQAFDELVAGYEKLIADHNEHEQRPIWQTDLAELLLYSYLQGTHLNASEFYDLGVPTKEQRDAFERMVPVAFEHLIDADQRFFVLQSELPRDEARHRQRINTGVWARMMEDYYGFRTPFFLAQAAYYTAILPNDHAYFRELGNNRKIPFQAKTASEEKKRLLALVSEKLQTLAADASDRRGVRLIALTFIGRAQTLAGQPAEAITSLDTVIGTNRGDLTHLSANLAKGRAMAAANQTLAALEHLTRTEFHPLAVESLYMRLLVVDQQHQVLLKTTPDSAFDPYLNLLADRNLPEEQREGLRILIYNRWASSIPDSADLTKQPPVVLAAIGELARLEGQDLWNRAYLARQDERTQEAEDLDRQAGVKFDRSVRVLTTLLSRSNLDPKVEAKGLFNLAYAKYFKDPANPAVLLEAAKLWSDMAEKMPDTPEAVEALGNAEGALRPWFESPQKPPGVREAYLRAANLLFAKFPESSQAHNARLYYGFAVLLPAGEYAKAADMFQKVPQGHPTYPDSRREWVLAMQQMYENAPPAERAKARQEALQAAEFVREETARSLETALPADQPILKETLGWTLLALFDLKVGEGKPEEAMSLVSGFEKEYEDIPVLVQGLLERRIILLSQQGRNTELEEQAREMMLKFPDDAAPVINSVLNKLEQEIDDLRTQANNPENIANKPDLLARASSRAATASALAGLLMDWARKRGLDDDEMLPYELIYVKALRLAGEVDKALEVIRPISAKSEFSQNPNVIHEYAETLFAHGLRDGQVVERARLVAAAEQYKGLIFGFSMGPFPPVFWNAWMRWMQIADAINEGTEGIAPKVRELAAFDPNLGGEPYRSELRRLEIKHTAAGR